MTSVVALVVMSVYPVVVLGLYGLYRAPTATALTFLLAELALPPLYVMPAPLPHWMDRSAVAGLSALVGSLLMGRGYVKRSRPLKGAEALFLVIVASSLLTTCTNTDPLRYGPRSLPGMTVHDFISETIQDIISWWLPYYLGRAMFRKEKDLIGLTRIMVFAAFVYTLPILIELRMSPQVCYWIYGYQATAFNQTIRWGGYRPVVLVGHGLSLSQWFLFCVMMAIGFQRTQKRMVWGLSMTPLVLFLILVLVLCKSTGAIIYALLLLPMIAFAPPTLMATTAFVVALIVIVYPLLRVQGLVPTQDIGAFFVSVSPERAQSLVYRFDMESGLIGRMLERVWFGWGGYARGFVYDSFTGRPITVIDGWVISILSTRGVVGFVSVVGLFLAPVFRVRKCIRQLKVKTNRLLVGALGLVIATFAFDLILNATISPFFVMLAGALNGVVTGLPHEEASARNEDNQSYVTNTWVEAPPLSTDPA